jgi:hypothetical protein
MDYFFFFFSRTAGRLESSVPTFTVIVPASTVLVVEGSPSTVTVTVAGDVAQIVITTAPAVATPVVPVEYWQHDPVSGVPGWNGDEPAPTVWPYDPEEWVREPAEILVDEDADEPPPASSFRDFDPEAENDPWLQGR